MSFRTIVFSLVVFALSLATARADTTADFHKLLDKHWQKANEEQVFFHTDPDGWKPDGKLADISKAGFDRRQKFNDQMLAELAKIPMEKLSAEDKISYRLFKYERELEQESYTTQDRYFPVTYLFGWFSYFAEAPANMAFLTRQDYEKFLVSLEDYPRFNRENTNLLREGIKAGYTQYCESFQNYHKNISTYITDRAEDSPLFVPFKKFPATFPDKLKKEMAAQAKKLITEKVTPAYREFYEFWTKDYMPNCRKEAGISSLPGGADYYAWAIRFFTTTDMTAQEIHDLGLSEVKRIRAEMDAIIKKVGFKGSYKEFLEFLRTDDRFYATDEQDLMEKTAYINMKMYGELPYLFGTLPRNTFTVKATKNRGTFYMPPPDNRTPGTYFLSVKSLRDQPLFSLVALSLHEGVPGHHLQNALAMESEVPAFRRTLNHNAYTEGWGLYSEKLGLEAGMYDDPYADFGRLSNEIWRAYRLVVDTGLHAMGWERQKAIDLLVDNTGLSEAEAAGQIDRYISWPGQALSYKVGELKLLELRQRAEKKLGEKFDIRAFHDVILGDGSLPLSMLEETVDEWIKNQTK
ncbi:DUF885 domain-containing protein [Emcibacter sp.]|uniref:DUF885 domain-containing protein n=1 Tax=Emcibacter sp. TaxID=1979954 RepID=UPI003A91273E